MINRKDTLIAFATRWGSHLGGINSFNADLLSAFGIAYNRSVHVVCVVLSASDQDKYDAKQNYVHLVPVPGFESREFREADEPTVYDALVKAEIRDFAADSTIWLGHDRITGGIALAAAKARGGRSALIHHMSYERYEAFAESAIVANEKSGIQKALFLAADKVLAVGPLLRDAANDMLGRTDVHMLVPGLPDIPVAPAPRFFTAFLSGRLGPDAARIKQAHLGVAAFAHAVLQAETNVGFPDPLKPTNEPCLRLRGINLESDTADTDLPASEQELKQFAEEYANRVINLQALPFTTNRDALFDDLRISSVALMPSWHEGFGLVAWEAIGAGVPLVVSEKSGVFRLLKEIQGGMLASLVIPIDVRGSNRAPYFQQADLDSVANATIQVASNPQAARTKAARLREALSNYSWAGCAKDLAQALGWAHVIQELPVVGAVESPSRDVASTETREQSPWLEVSEASWSSQRGLPESWLLRAEAGVVPFDPKREPFLQELMTWAKEDSFPISIRLIVGQGGVGKTRLAVELTKRLREQDWHAGFLRGNLLESQVPSLARDIAASGKSHCIVLDYAETKQSMLLALVRALILTTQADQQAPVRVLLLARDGGEWWEHLPGKHAATEAILLGRATTGPYRMPDLYGSLPEREQAYQHAVEAFATCLGAPTPAAIPNLSAEHFALPLYVHMAALMGIRGERPLSAEALPRALLNHERRYWRKALEGVEPRMEESKAAVFIALSTVAGGIATPRDLGDLWNASGVGTSSELKALFRTLAPLYPGRQGMQALRPDILGEALVAQVLLAQEGRALLDAILCKQGRPFHRAALTVLARLLRRRDDLIPLIEDALVAQYSSCARDLVQVCMETASPLPGLAENAFGRLVPALQQQVAGMIRACFEFEVVPLTGLGVLVSDVLVKAADRALGNHQGSLEAEACFAQANSTLAVSLVRAGNTARALLVGRVSLDIFARLARQNRERFEPNWAASLNNYANHLSENGKTDEALAFAKQALEIRERLARAKPERFEPSLAGSLNNYAGRLSENGKRDEALAFAKQALDIYERLAHAKPERFEPDWATSLNNYASRLSENGKTDEALAFAKQALEIRERLARAKPERFEPDWAISLNNCASHLSDNGKTDEALAFAKQALDIHERLARAKPERFEPDWAGSLNNYANRLSDNGKTDEALAFAKQALDIYEHLARAKPERFEPDWAMSLNNYAGRLSENGKTDEALAFAKQALDIYERLARAKPERFEPERAGSLADYAMHLADVGKWMEALAPIETGSHIYARRAKGVPRAYGREAEESSLYHRWLRWLCTADEHTEGEIAKGEWLEFLSERNRKHVNFQRAWVAACISADTSRRITYFNQMLDQWDAMDVGQRAGVESVYLLGCAWMQSVGALCDLRKSEYRARLPMFSARRHDCLPEWMGETAKRLEIPWPQE